MANPKNHRPSSSQLPQLPRSQFLEVGRIVAAQGLKGEVRVYPSSDFPERFLQPGSRWLLRPGQPEPEPVELVQGRYLTGKHLYVLKFAQVGDRTQAEALKDAVLLVSADDRPLLEADEFHVMDLVGLEVVNQLTQEVVGTVVGLIQAGNDLLEVKRPSGHLPAIVLIPFVKAIVPVVDLEIRRIEITPPAGLIE